MELFFTLGFFFLVFALYGFKRIPSHTQGLVYTQGRLSRVQDSGVVYVIPLIQKIVFVDFRPQVLNLEHVELITPDSKSIQLSLSLEWSVADSAKAIASAPHKDLVASLRKLVSCVTKEPHVVAQAEDSTQSTQLLQSVLEESLRNAAHAAGLHIAKVRITRVASTEPHQTKLRHFYQKLSYTFFVFASLLVGTVSALILLVVLYSPALMVDPAWQPPSRSFLHGLLVGIGIAHTVVFLGFIQLGFQYRKPIFVFFSGLLGAALIVCILFFLSVETAAFSGVLSFSQSLDMYTDTFLLVSLVALGAIFVAFALSGYWLSVEFGQAGRNLLFVIVGILGFAVSYWLILVSLLLIPFFYFLSARLFWRVHRSIER